ncbi:MAG: MFS transporter [Candidatus Margulisiibacteriota bacterium]
MQNRKIFGFDKNIFWLGITSFFTDIGSEMIYPILPIFLSSVLGVNKAFIGLIEGIAEATSSLLKLVSGWVSDKMGKRKEIVVLGYSLSTIAKPLLALANSGWNVLGLRFLDRLGKGLRTSPRDALIAESCDSCDRGKSFGFHRALDSAGAMVGPGIAFVLMCPPLPLGEGMGVRVLITNLSSIKNSLLSWPSLPSSRWEILPMLF